MKCSFSFFSVQILEFFLPLKKLEVIAELLLVIGLLKSTFSLHYIVEFPLYFVQVVEYQKS